MNLTRTVAKIRAMSRCAHAGDFDYIHAMGNTAVGRCVKCKSHVTASPSSIHYEKILAAKKRKGRLR